jgi:hypothetical protein
MAQHWQTAIRRPEPTQQSAPAELTVEDFGRYFPRTPTALVVKECATQGAMHGRLHVAALLQRSRPSYLVMLLTLMS